MSSSNVIRTGYQGNTVNSEIFARVLFSRSFVKIESSRYDKITLSYTNIGKSIHSREFLMLHIHLLTLFGKIKFSGKFPNLL